MVHVANIDVGLKVHLGHYMQYQRDQGYDVSAITHPGRWLSEDTTILNGIFVKIIPFEPRISPLADLRTLVRLVRYFRRERFDIVHTHTVKPGLLGRLAARMARVPVVVHTVHGFYFFEGMNRAQYALYAMVEKIGSACSDLILSQNKQDIETAVRERICPPEKIHYLGNGIDLDTFNPSLISPERVLALRDELGIPPAHALIGFAARLEQDKGICEFLEAASILKSRAVKARFLVIGEVPASKRSSVSLPELLHKLNIENEVMLLGYRNDIPELLSLMDILVLPSHGREGVPRILMESAALGKPVVATRVRGNVEAVEDGVTGLLVPVRDSSALAEGIMRLLDNPGLAAEMGAHARQRALTHFDERHFFVKTDVEYRRLLEAKLGIKTDEVLKPVMSTAIKSDCEGHYEH
ncbi:MAG: glycosyltransferase family 4 protein [Anaerolineae bacterium]